MMSSSVSVILAPQPGAYVLDQMIECRVIHQPGDDHTHAVEHGGVVSIAQEVGDALRLERDIRVRHRPAQLGAHQVHADLPGRVHPCHAATPAQLPNGDPTFGGDGVPDAAGLDRLLSSQAL